MAKKRRKKSSAPKTTRKVKAVRRRGKRRSKGMLSEFFTPATAMQAGKTVLSGAVGGGMSIVMDMAMPNQTVLNRGLYKVLGGFVFASVLRMPNVGAGMAAVGTYQILSDSFGLSENGDWSDPIEALPMFMSEDGMMLSQNDVDAMLSDGGYLLSAGDRMQNPYPSYVPSLTY